jgi:predicted DNA-binding transcriptional regulator AlpA
MSATIFILTAILVLALVIDPGAGNTFTIDPSTVSLVLVAAAMDAKGIEPLVVSIKEAARIVAVSRAQFYKWVRDKRFTLIKVTDRRSAILVSELKDYIAERTAASKLKAAAPPASMPEPITAAPIEPTPPRGREAGEVELINP